MERAHGVGDGRRRGCVGDDDGGDASGGEDARRFVDEGLTKEARIAADENAMGGGLGLDEGGDAGNGAANVGDSEFVGYDGPPAGSAEFDGSCHEERSSFPVH